MIDRDDMGAEPPLGGRLDHLALPQHQPCREGASERRPGRLIADQAPAAGFPDDTIVKTALPVARIRQGVIGYVGLVEQRPATRAVGAGELARSGETDRRIQIERCPRQILRRQARDEIDED